ncbi:fungal-specific transcription factor domain-containing protein [Apiosordaria backusii]|uniref:Fungal-specific transcription factor domain-containing protein n=1 Tax=Apiosordaria backusii TaxID=314023 RepID=A0AA40ERW4_9PEZI|nr:fungal-specific transcription factor domain-containing protein [Apiosordaria backusii]
MSATSSGAVSLGRVSTACARCRRQKLKCDVTKPCTMCVRSGVECQPRSVPESTPRRRKASSDLGDDGDGIARMTRRPRTTSTGPEAARRSTGPDQTSPEHVSPLTRQVTGSIETQQFGANRSTISLAMNMYENFGTRAPTKSSTIPGDASSGSPSGPVWELQTMQMPAPSVMEKLIDVYFDRLHWFIWIFHRPSFMNQARDIITASAWRREDMSKILVTLTVAALGLKCAIQNTSPQGQQFLASVSPDPQRLVNQMIGEVRVHLLDLLDDSCIETVQVTVLLGAYYIFHGSPSLAWAMIGMSVRASYALALHCELDSDDQVSTQIRRRCWNHVTVADTFASQIYGRPASLDPAFSNLLPLADMGDDTVIDVPSGEHGIQNGVGGGAVSALTFHWLKYRLYEIIRKTISTFRLLQLNSPMTAEDLQSLIDAVQRVDAQLAEWRKTLPPPLDSGDVLDDHSPRGLWVLQITYDAAIILAHRPLLEHRLSSEYRQGISKSSVDLISRSFDVSIKAALRISQTPVMEFEHEFCLAFIFVHLFTAGVILCIPPTSHPYSNTAHEAKAGVFRIIRAAKALSARSQIARHAEQLLSDLLKLSLHCEVDMVFKDDRKTHQGQGTNQPPAEPPCIANNTCETGMSTSERQHDPPDSDFNQNQYRETLLQVPSTSNSETPLSSLQQDYDHPGSFGDEWAAPYPVFNLVNAVGSNIQTLDLPLDEAFGAFGQVMFNLMPDDPLNNWGWGRGSI